jgi:hypothetical protein
MEFMLASCQMICGRWILGTHLLFNPEQNINPQEKEQKPESP